MNCDNNVHYGDYAITLARHVYKAGVTYIISHIRFEYTICGHFVDFNVKSFANNKKAGLMAIPHTVIVPYETMRAHHSLFLGL